MHTFRMHTERRILTLLRHADAEPQRPTYLDRDRDLSAAGIAQCAMLRDRLIGRRFDLVICSPARRTRRSLELAVPNNAVARARIEIHEEWYLASDDVLLQAVRDRSNGMENRPAEHILVIGHNPGLHNMVNRLAGGDALPQGMGTATLVDLAIAGPWNELRSAAGRLTGSFTPAPTP